MDFLSRLIGGGSSTPTRKSSANNPQQRLQRFRKTYNQALQSFNKITLVGSDPIIVNAIRDYFNKLTTLLHDDSRAPAPHLCLSFAASPQVFTAIASIASRLNNDDIVREAVAIYSALVDSDEENLLGNETFARELMLFVETLMDGSSKIGRQAEGEILELAFGIAAKIRLEPDLLPIWFNTTRDASDGRVFGKVEMLPEGDRKAFPLCHQFAGYVYHEGRAGDFARTGLLYIFETASHYNGLEGWIVSSELPTLMATGLGALYSQLSRKLAIAPPDDRLPLILALSDNDHHPLAEDADSFYADGLQERLRTFMSNLVFWQDILEHCRSLEIKQTLIEHFQIFFLQQILYPSLLESSDMDGGSSVAVLTYLWRILDTVDHPDLIHLILNYLLALSDPLEEPKSTISSDAASQTHVSLQALPKTVADTDELTPTFFNLIDLINGSVRSENTETVRAALRLVSVILSKHHQHAITSMIRSVPFRQSALTRTIGSLRRDLEAFMSVAQAIGGSEGMDDSYQNCLKDGLAMVETHVCSVTKFGTSGSKAALGKRRETMLDNQLEPHDHYLLDDDPLLQALLARLKTFFTNDIETNLELTQVISHLASCPSTRLEGWLVTEVSRRKQKSRQAQMTMESSLASLPERDGDEEPNEPTEEDRIAALKVASEKHDATEDKEPPQILKILQDLQGQLALVKTSVTDMEAFIKGRKRAFQGATEIENELRFAAPSILSPRLSRTTSRDSSATRSNASTYETPTKQKGGNTRLQRGRTAPSAMLQNSKALRSSKTTSPSQMALSARPSSPSPSMPARALSPLKASFTPADLNGMSRNVGQPKLSASEASADGTSAEDEEEEIFERKISFPVAAAEVIGQSSSSNQLEPNVSSVAHEAAQITGNAESREATLNHVLTNIIILQEFVLEMAALIHVRSSLLDREIKFV